MGPQGSSGAASCCFFCRTKQKRCLYCPFRLAESFQIGGCQAILRKIQAAGEFPAVQSFRLVMGQLTWGMPPWSGLRVPMLELIPTHDDVCCAITIHNQSSRNLLSTYMMRAQLSLSLFQILPWRCEVSWKAPKNQLSHSYFPITISKALRPLSSVTQTST